MMVAFTISAGRQGSADPGFLRHLCSMRLMKRNK